jgi:hypothetical protein
MFQNFPFVLKDEHPCHIKHPCRAINGLISYGLCDIVIMWCINSIKLSKHILN